jgi:hypothetical protein
VLFGSAVLQCDLFIMYSILFLSVCYSWTVISTLRYKLVQRLYRPPRSINHYGCHLFRLRGAVLMHAASLLTAWSVCLCFAAGTSILLPFWCAASNGAEQCKERSVASVNITALEPNNFGLSLCCNSYRCFLFTFPFALQIRNQTAPEY